MIFIFSVSDVVAGDYITIFTKSNGRSYYVGWYNHSESRKEMLVPDTLLPRDLMASTYHGRDTRCAVKLGTVIPINFYTCLSFWDKIGLVIALSDICQHSYGARISVPSLWMTGTCQLYLFTSQILGRNINIYSQFITFLHTDRKQISEIISPVRQGSA